EPFLTALSLGAPPHGGFALGLDRYIACLAAEGTPHASVREIIAFPKTKEGRCAMFSTPFEPDNEMLSRYHCSFDRSSQS
uniref:Aminoacyl-tRNA synthetase class II (D/K/N) domain-containing protein n=1 Tax=Panagrolaimus sp. ES5 TaxID=591445 RepID=A0AC34F2D6_9BILA